MQTNKRSVSVEQSRAQSLAVWILLILLVVFLRLPSFVEAFFDPDVAATVYSAQLFAAGGCLYPEAVETKPPGSYAVFAGTKFFTHYYFFLLPPLCGLAALGIDALATKFSGNGRRIFPLLLLLSLLACQQRELRFAALGAKALLTTGRPVSREIFALNRSLGAGWLDFVTPYNHLEWELASRTAGKYIRAHSAPDDGLLVYDYLPSVYWYARRFAPTRHHMNFEVAYELAPEFGKWYDRETARLAANRAELLDDLRTAPPAFIVRARYAPPVKNELAFHPSNVYGDPAGAVLWQTPLFADLAQFVAENYHEVAELSDLPLLVLQRNDHLP